MEEVLRNCGIGGNRTYEVGPVIHIVFGQKITKKELAAILRIPELPETLDRICGKPETALLIGKEPRWSSVLETWGITPELCFQTFTDERFVRWEDRLPIGFVTIDGKGVSIYQANSAPDDNRSPQ